MAMGEAWHGELRVNQSYGYGHIIYAANKYGRTTAAGLLRARELHGVPARATGDFPFTLAL